MTFPTIPTSGANTLITTSQSTATTTHTFGSLTTLDNASGDLLLAIIVTYLGGSSNADFSSWGGGFTEFVDQATNSATVQSIGAAYKFSDGTETGTFTVTSAGSTRSVMFLLSVKGAHASTVPEATARATGTTGAADPASLNPTGWDVTDTLWIAVGVNGETSLTGTFTGITAAPTNYSGYVDSGIIGGDIIGALEGALAFRQNQAASEDAGGFTLDTGAAGNSALVIAVRPAPAIVTGTITSNLGFTAPAAGVPIAPAISTLTDDFSTIDTAKWDVTGTVVSTAGEAEITPVSDGSGFYYPRLISHAKYNLTNSSAFVKVSQVLSVGDGSTETFFAVGPPGVITELVMFIIAGSNIIFRSRVGGSNNDTSLTYDSTAMRWLRFTEAASTVDWETSPDGSSWTSRRSLATPFAVADVVVWLAAGWWSGAVQSVGTAKFDNVNMVGVAGPVMAPVVAPSRPQRFWR